MTGSTPRERLLSALRRETVEIAEAAGKGGGLVIAPGHLIERDIPLENVFAFAETVTKLNGGAS